MKIKITKDILLDYAPPVGSVHDVLGKVQKDENTVVMYYIVCDGKKRAIFPDECEVIEE